MNLLSNVQTAIKVAALGASLLFACTASAGQFGVRVVGLDGLPVAGASVCFGLPGNYRQFGAVFTDIDGQAVVEVPNLPFVVTVSKTRFSGVRINEPARGFNLIKQVTLAEGTPGPRCKAGSTLADGGESSIHISQVQVLATSRSTSLVPETTGEPTEYRVSSSPEFSTAKWAKFDDSIRIAGPLAQGDRIYLQLRRFEGTNNGWIEARSKTATVFLSAPNTAL